MVNIHNLKLDFKLYNDFLIAKLGLQLNAREDNDF